MSVLEKSKTDAFDFEQFKNEILEEPKDHKQALQIPLFDQFVNEQTRPKGQTVNVASLGSLGDLKTRSEPLMTPQPQSYGLQAKRHNSQSFI